ncbi:MAG: glycosyltransferase family 39 protein [Gammaproteobacteria bacterium]|nr:glycosyltransferase family 39 protein [Gammaproteobacteria bacterium]
MTASFVRLTVIVAAVIWFALLGYRDLVEPDEGRYAEIPREMVASGDWVTPRLNGFKYFEKPALQYWGTAIGFELFGFSNATARLWPAVLGFLGALWAGYVGRRLYGKTAGFYAALITLSSLLYVGMGHHLTLDMSVSVFLALGIGSLALAQHHREDPAHVRRWMLVGWAGLALATLSKGLIGLVLPAAAIVIYSLWQRDWALWKHLHLGKGLLLFLAITAPWFIAVSLANPEFAHFFFIHEHFERYTTTVHHRDEPVWYFIPIFIGGTLPWLAIVLKSVFRPQFAWWPQPNTGFDTERWLWVFAIVTFAFFSVGHSKLPSYILPMVPVIAILAGRRLALEGISKIDAGLILALAVLLLVLAARITQFADTPALVQMHLNYRPWLFAAAATLGITAIFAFGAKLQPKRIALVAVLALLSFQMIFWGFQSLAGIRSSRAMADAIQANVAAGTTVYSVEIYYPQSLPFYLQQPIRLVAFKGELEMGIDQEPERWIASSEEFVKQWQKENQAVAIIDQNILDRYRSQGLSMREIFRDPQRIVVVKQ